MAWPATRLTTYAPGSQVKSADLNAIQDTVIAHETATVSHEARLDLLDVAQTRTFPAAAGQESAAGANWTHLGAYAEATVATPNALYVPLVLNSGETLTLKALVQHANATAGAIRVQLYRVALDGSETNVATVDSAAVTTVQDLTVVTGHAVVADNAYYLSIHSNGGTGGAMSRKAYSVRAVVTRV